MSALPPLHNRAIAASAGSGKTYRLAHRYIELLRRGVAPDRICALTFSRKAAGEIFDTIVNCLCDAATQQDKARDSSALLDIPTDPGQFLGLLRGFVDHLHRLRIGTIDSFTVGVARAFPLELGLAPDFRVGDNDDAAGAELRRDLLARLFDPSRTDARDQREFLEAYKLATFGREDKVIGRQLEAYITDLARVYRNSPGGPSVWGSETAIWNPPPPWRRLPTDVAGVYAEQLSAAAGALPAKLALATQEIAASLAAHDDHTEWNSKRENTLFKRLWKAVEEPDGAAFEFDFNRQTGRLPTAAADALRALVRHVMAVELTRVCRQTQGMARVLQLHEALYREQARRNGRLTFDDLTRLLGPEGGHPLSRTRAPDRLYIDYRLDGRLDHWLLDEFQDTSDAQWQVLRGLIDETIQDDSGQRSFFYVGDTKQAIYGWRGGNHKLFGRVLGDYNERIECRSLDESRRSAAAIIATVNQVFEQVTQEPGIPTQARHDWEENWRTHRTAREMAGCVELLEAADADDETGPNDALYAVIAARLREIRPAERGLRAAVLVRTNEQGRRCAELLRARCPDQAIVLDGAASLLDNALVPLMLALIRFAAHPGDTLAWRHLQMSPLGMLLANEPSSSIPATSAPHPPPALAEGDAALRAAVSLRLLRAIQEHGFLATLREWCGLLETLHALDAFGQRRRDDLFEAAAAFDATNDHDCDRFDRHVRAYAQRESVADDAVRVMTIHQSKGLGFDLVFVPFSRSGRSFTDPGRADVLAADDDRWVLLTPPQTVVKTDSVLKQAADHRASQAAFAQLCVFYVALTRAKQGLYLVVPPPTKTETDTCREDTVLRHALAGNVKAGTLPGSGQVLFRAGQSEWYAGPENVRKNAPHAAPDAATPATLRAGPPRLARREPSKLDLITRPAAALFSREAGDVLAFGTAIHRLFQRVEWLDTLDVDRIVAAWRATATETAPILRDAERQFRASLDRPDVRQALTRPPGSCVLWREKAFELMLDGSVVAGQFDRVVIGHDAGGRPTNATILDFKSNRIESDDALHRTAAGYRDQLGLYAIALRRILGPSLTHIAQALLFTRAGRVVVLN